MNLTDIAIGIAMPIAAIAVMLCLNRLLERFEKQQEKRGRK